MNVNDASRPKNSKQAKSGLEQKFRDQNWQWNYPHMSMSFPSHESPMLMPCGSYFYMHYSCPKWSYNPWMPASHSYFGQNHVTYREPVINESSLRNNDHFQHRDQSMQKKSIR